MLLYLYIHKLVGRIYKILPLKEREERGEEIFLKEYIEGLWNDMRGAYGTFPELNVCEEYLSVCNKISFLNCEDEFNIRTCRREVFSALKLLNQLEEKLAGEADV